MLRLGTLRYLNSLGSKRYLQPFPLYRTMKFKGCYTTESKFRLQLKALYASQRIPRPKRHRSFYPKDTLFSNVDQHLIDVSVPARILDAKIKLFYKLSPKRRVSKLFECAKLPPLPKPKPVPVPMRVEMDADEKAQILDWHQRFENWVVRRHQERRPAQDGQNELAGIISLYEEVEEGATRRGSFSRCVSRLIAWLLKSHHRGLALTLFQRYARAVASQGREQVEYDEQTARNMLYMAHILASYFSKAKDLDSTFQVYWGFQELGLDDGGEMEYKMAVAHAAVGEFHSAKQFLAKAVAEFKFELLPLHLNELLEHALDDSPVGLEFGKLVVQYMDYKFPPSHLSQPTLNARTFALRARLCSTPQQLTQLFGLADQFCLLPSRLLQDALITRGAQLLEQNPTPNTHLLHGWLNRLHRPKTRFLPLWTVPAYRPISQNAEMACVYAFCRAGCAISATSTMTSLLTWHTISPLKKRQLFKAILTTILQNIQAYHVGWKTAIKDFLGLYFRTRDGRWEVDPTLHSPLIQVLVNLNEPSWVNSYLLYFSHLYLPGDLSHSIAALEGALASPNLRHQLWSP